ncbi:MAG: RHS repeat-associated core domain-containing protein, partial [Anaerolineales bacterium]|nr:RHS repeat-associated core domain-containing protein [Anaerolineales bacterium]
YTVQVCTDSPTNCTNLVSNPGTSGTHVYHGASDHTYTFRITATDHVDNATTKESGASTAAVTKYYLFGGQRVAMRVGDAVYYLYGDHLGSTSLTTDATGGLVSQARYTPFGEVAWDGGTVSPTDFEFTGQRADSYIKLLDYGARWYDARLGRFVSADSIVPGVGNPMAWDRYSYVMGNPMNLVDPSGHRSCSADQAATGDETCDQNASSASGDLGPTADPAKTLKYISGRIINSMKPGQEDAALRRVAEAALALLGGRDDLEALAQIIEAADSIYAANDLTGFLNGINLVIAGTAYVSNAPAGSYLWNAVFGNPCAAVGGDDCPTNTQTFGDAGFHRDFRDGNNQLFHLWSAFLSGVEHAYRGVFLTGIGNMFHEGGEYILGKTPLGSIVDKFNSGQSWEDYALTGAGVALAVDFNSGSISRSDLGNYFRTTFGPSGPGSNGFVTMMRNLNPLNNPYRVNSLPR